jgi:aminopeptidase N
MEYDGATTASMESIPHEVFHSWFGRGVKPSSARDGWIDEAYTSWCTSRVQDAPPLTPRALDLDETPTVLAPASAWSRFTPRAAYRMGYRLFAGLAHLSSTDAVQDAMAQLYRERAGGFVSTDDLGRHLSESLGIDVGPWWDRYVWGRA